MSASRHSALFCLSRSSICSRVGCRNGDVYCASRRSTFLASISSGCISPGPSTIVVVRTLMTSLVVTRWTLKYRTGVDAIADRPTTTRACARSAWSRSHSSMVDMAGWMTAGLGTTEKLAAPARYRRSIARAGTLTRSPYPRPAEVTALQVRTATSKRASLHNVICTHINAAAIAHRTKDEIRKVGVMIEEAWMMLDA